MEPGFGFSVVPRAKTIAALPAGSVRRAAELRRLHPRLRFANLRDNVEDPGSLCAHVRRRARAQRPDAAHRRAPRPGGINHAVGQGAAAGSASSPTSLSPQSPSPAASPRPPTSSPTPTGMEPPRVVRTEEEAEALGYKLAEVLVKAGARAILRDSMANRAPKNSLVVLLLACPDTSDQASPMYV